jgi:hypothetical protein
VVEDAKQTEEQQRAMKKKMIGLFVNIAVVVFAAGLIFLPFFNIGRYPLQGLHFLLPLSLYAYLLFFLCAGGFCATSFYEIRKRNYKIKWILYFLIVNVVIICNFFYIAPFASSFRHATIIAADSNNTLYVFDSFAGDIVRENADKDLYNRYYVPKLKEFLNYSLDPCVTSNGLCIFASMEEGVITYDVNTGKENHWQPDGLTFIYETFVDANDDILFVAYHAEETKCAQWHKPDGALIRKVIFDEQLPCDADFFAFSNGHFLFIDMDELVYVLDENGQQVNIWKLPGVSHTAPDSSYFYGDNNTSADGALYFLLSERGLILKCDLNGNEQGRISLDKDGFYHRITSGFSGDIFVSEELNDTVKQYDRDGNLRYTHGRFQWRHYRAFLRNLFMG